MKYGSNMNKGLIDGGSKNRAFHVYIQNLTLQVIMRQPKLYAKTLSQSYHIT